MKTKKLFLAAAILILNSTFLIFDCSAQNIGINSTGAVPNASAALDIDMNNAGLLIPRLTTAQATTLAATAAEGLMIFNTDTKCFQVFNTTWQNMFCTCTSAPATPGSITGTTSICANSTGISYSIAAVTGATSYTWSAPAGATITSGQGTTNILVNFGASSGNISVTATNSCGTSAASSLVITITASPTTANAGPDQNLSCAATSTTLSGNAPGVGTGLWTLISGTATITTPSSPTSTLTSISGNIVLRWAISNSPCIASFDEITIFPNTCTTDDAFTVLKLHMDGTSFSDASANAYPVTANGNAQISTAQEKFCENGLFDGTGDYLRVGSASDWKFLHGAEDPSGFKWTYDEWISITAIGGRAVLIATNYNTAPGLELTIETNASIRVEISAQAFGGSPVMSYNSAASVYPNDLLWHHVAVTYDQSLGSNNMNWYIDGVLVGTATKTANTPNTGDPAHPLSIGEEGGQAWTFNGKRDELRISKGSARWTGNYFTPPASPYCD